MLILATLQVLLERGERPKAKYQYEKILGKALLGHGRAEHWAHSEYAWIAFEDGDLQVGTVLSVSTQFCDARCRTSLLSGLLRTVFKTSNLTASGRTWASRPRAARVWIPVGLAACSYLLSASAVRGTSISGHLQHA